jgi:serine/threonine protein phosphatase PrpC
MEHLKSTLMVRLAQHSDAGRKSENQDTLGARIPDSTALATKGIALAIADGVSSSLAGKEASQAAVAGFLSDYYATPDTWRTQQSAVQVIQSLNRYLFGKSQSSLKQEGHLTTFSCLILKGDKAFCFHVGDSRIYRLRDASLEQLTRDHAQRVDEKTTYLTRALGADPVLEVDMSSYELEIGDIFVLTTDGVHDYVNAQLIGQCIKDAYDDFDSVAQGLCQLALANNSQDNLSIQICRVEARGTASQTDAVTVLSRLPFPPFLQVGHILDGLTVKKILHESERSQVYLVHTAEGNPLVMKTPSVNYEDDPVYIERFVLESWIGARIHNAHVVRVVEPPSPRSCLYYLTEYIQGPSLTQLIKERAPFAIPDAIELVEQLIKGLRAFHRKDTLHQDLKPDNVIIGKRGATIVDFGSCWVAGIQEAGATFERDTILGTLDYSAPEYRLGRHAGERSDLFSLGVLLYEMLTKKLPFGSAYSGAMDYKSLQKLSYVSACSLNPLIPFWLDKTLEKALHINPERRYESLSEWLQDLKRPNPNLLTQRERPLLERDPLKFWRVAAGVGWLAFFATLLGHLAGS